MFKDARLVRRLTGDQGVRSNPYNRPNSSIEVLGVWHKVSLHNPGEAAPVVTPRSPSRTNKNEFGNTKVDPAAVHKDSCQLGCPNRGVALATLVAYADGKGFGAFSERRVSYGLRRYSQKLSSAFRQAGFL